MLTIFAVSSVLVSFWGLTAAFFVTFFLVIAGAALIGFSTDFTEAVAFADDLVTRAMMISGVVD